MALFGRFTERAQRVFNAAQMAAAELHRPVISTEHVLLGLLKEDNNIPAAIASKASYEQVLEAIKQNQRGDSELYMGRPRFELTPRAKKLLELAVMESRRLGQAYVSTEHLWLAILSMDDGIPAGILRQLHVDFSEAREELLRGIRMEQTPEEDRSAGGPQTQRRGKEDGSSVLSKYSHDLTEAARSGELDPVIGRDMEIQRLIQILHCPLDIGLRKLIFHAGIGIAIEAAKLPAQDVFEQHMIAAAALERAVLRGDVDIAHGLQQGNGGLLAGVFF